MSEGSRGTIVMALGWYFPESLGGTEVYVAALGDRLRRAGYRVLVAAPETGISEERSYEFQGIPVYRYPIPSRPSRSQCQGRDILPGPERLHRWLEEIRPDVFHCHSFVTGLGLDELKAARRAGAKLVATAHSASLGYLCQRGTMLRWGRELCDGLAEPRKCASCELQHRGMPKLLARTAAHLPRFAAASRAFSGALGTMLSMPALIEWNQERQAELLRTVDRFVVLTNWAMQALVANFGEAATRDKLTLNRLGVDNRVFSLRHERRTLEPPVRFGYLGRFDAVKGVVELARAVKSLPAGIPFTLELRGPVRGEREQEVFREVKSIIARDPRVRFGEEVSPGEVASLLAGYDVVIESGIGLEGGPTVALEAMAVGTAVIGTNVGGLAEIVSDGVSGRLVPPANVAALAEAIREVALAPENTVNRWRRQLPPPRTMDVIAAETIDLYQGIRCPVTEDDVATKTTEGVPVARAESF